MVGYDRFFFFRPLNPTNSFILSMAYNCSFNLSEKGGKDYRNPQAKPGKSQVEQAESGLTINGNPFCQGANAKTLPFCIKTVPRNFEDAYQYEGFLQTALQTDYLHGKLSPRLVIITDVSGIFAFQPSATYRITDSFLFGGDVPGHRGAAEGVARHLPRARHGAAPPDVPAQLGASGPSP